ncbi:MAG: Phenylalanine-tRNA ligase alpha subunit [candidate division TM6 bacterium GW2011_GWF2_43_17]|nr:MAG: Phenylalanine-tRNA ligase alpha subunit [candidate division TM6 bacterium GW2011_GWF2_43_17]
MHAFEEKLKKTQITVISLLESAKSPQELAEVESQILGKQGLVAQLINEFKTLSGTDKKQFGSPFNQFREEIRARIAEKKQQGSPSCGCDNASCSIPLDVTAYRAAPIGSLHPETHAIYELEDVLTSMGFALVEGPELETEFYNFDALNIPPTHPARDMQDTFWLPQPHHLLRTHTSSVQIRAMQKQRPPLSIAAIGRVYRCEATDASHDYTFLQCEGLVIDKKNSLANLFATTKLLLQKLFKNDNLQIRVRPSYFPFVEPGVEIDLTCPFCTSGCPTCKKSRWIEICGAGLVHPNVLKAGGINPQEWSGFAFGFGLTRLIMLKYGIDDIRHLHNAKIEFLQQF